MRHIQPLRGSRRLIIAEILLELWVHALIILTIENKIYLLFVFTGPGHIGRIEGIPIRRNQTRLCPVEILVFDCVGGKCAPVAFSLFSGRMILIFFAGGPFETKSFPINISVLTDDCRYPLWVASCQSAADWSAIVEDLQRIPAQILQNINSSSDGVRSVL
jgi:hypothetical protein